jgi:hypothetical protein
VPKLKHLMKYLAEQTFAQLYPPRHLHLNTTTSQRSSRRSGRGVGVAQTSGLLGLVWLNSTMGRNWVFLVGWMGAMYRMRARVQGGSALPEDSLPAVEEGRVLGAHGEHKEGACAVAPERRRTKALCGIHGVFTWEVLLAPHMLLLMYTQFCLTGSGSTQPLQRRFK